MYSSVSASANVRRVHFFQSFRTVIIRLGMFVQATEVGRFVRLILEAEIRQKLRIKKFPF